MRNSVTIVPNDENWPAEFDQIGTSLRRALGDRAVRIDHIGSTAVPGLPAKDIIDVQVTVAAAALARLHPDDQDAYYDVKDPVCDLIIDAAEHWATMTGYVLEPSDRSSRPSSRAT